MDDSYSIFWQSITLLLQHHGFGEIVEESLLHGEKHYPAQDEVQGEQERLPKAWMAVWLISKRPPSRSVTSILMTLFPRD